MNPWESAILGLIIGFLARPYFDIMMKIIEQAWKDYREKK